MRDPTHSWSTGVLECKKITNWSEQLKNKEFQNVKNTLQKHKQQDNGKRGEESVGKLIS